MNEHRLACSKSNVVRQPSDPSADLDASWGSSGHSRGVRGFPLFVRVVRTLGNLETAGAVCCLFAGTASAAHYSTRLEVCRQAKAFAAHIGPTSYALQDFGICHVLYKHSS